jgi:hypothetical protein
MQQVQEPLLHEEEVMTLAALAYVAGIAIHYLVPELSWMGDLFRGGAVEILLVLILGSVMYYGYASIFVSLAFGIHTASLYTPLVELFAIFDYPWAVLVNASSQGQLQTPEQAVVVMSIMALVLNLLLCISAAAFGAHLHWRNRRAALALVLFWMSAYAGHLLGVLL